MKKLLMLLVLVSPIAVYAEESDEAKAPVVKQEKNCEIRESAQPSVRIKLVDKTAVGAVNKIAETTTQVESIAREASLTRFEERSASYSLGQNMLQVDDEDDENMLQMDEAANKQWRLMGRASYDVEPVEKAAELVQMLSDKGFSASVSIRKNRDKGCK